MFEDQTEEVILKRMMNKVPSDIDKRESSVIFNTLAPISIELAIAYSKLNYFLKCAFPTSDTPDEYIESRAKESGIKRKQSTRAIKKGYFYDSNKKPINIPIGSRLSIDKVNYKAINKIDLGIYAMECEELGSIGNIPSGKLIPIDYIEGLGIAELKDILSEGVDIEPVKDLYNRYLEKVQRPITSGNINNYRHWALEVEGVGKVKIFPLWQGNGTVKIVIVDSNKKTPDKTLVDKVYKYINEKRPIGANITVKGAIEKKINICAKVTLTNGFNIGQVKQEFTTLLDKYIKEIAFELSYISIAKIGNLLLNTPGVLDYVDLKINNSISNIGLEDEEISVLDVVDLEVK